MKKVVIALGGNALQARGEAATSENQLKNVLMTSEHIAKIINEGKHNFVYFFFLDT
ncbi:MAG: hypothetical protein IKG72_05325 [Bacillus sp. (in: Bacteria)]|nr:hypothetical protein [Bacillus sp. (in: firmicutes)]